MRLLFGTVGLTLLALVALAPGLAVATEGDFALASGVPIRFSGALDAESERGILVADGSHGSLNWVLTHEGAQLVDVIVYSSYAVAPTGGSVLVERSLHETHQSLPPGRIEVTQRFEGFKAYATSQTLRIQSGTDAPTPQTVWSHANAQLTAPLIPPTWTPSLRAPLEETLAPSNGWFPQVEEGSFEIRADPAKATVTDVSTVGVASGRIQWGSEYRDARLLTSTQPGGLYIPNLVTPGGSWTGPGSHIEEVLHYLVLHPKAGELSVTSQGVPLHVYAETPRIGLEGYVQFPWARGKVTTDEGTLRFDGEQVVLGGDLTLRPLNARLRDAASLDLIGAGDLTYVQIGATTHTWSPARVALAAGGGAALGLSVLAAAYYWPLLKYAATGLWAPLYARVPRDHILDHKGRDQVYERVRSEPGISTNKLAEGFPFGWSTLTYHLRVLERNGAIVSLRDGRHRRFFDRQSGKFSNGRKYIVAALKNEATLAIARKILASPGITQKELSECFDLAPSSVYWHSRRLTNAGLLEKRRDAHHVRYFPGKAWNEVHPEEVGISGSPTLDPFPVESPPSPAQT